MTKLLINKTILEQLFNENYNSLYYHAYSFTNDPEISKDIVNDVFEEIWKKRHKIDISYSLKSFMYRMVKNKSINHLRHQEVENKYLSYAMLRSDQYDDSYKDYDSLLEKIKKAIEELPPQGKAVFKKCFIENLSYKEVAEELDVSVNTVKTHVSKSLKRLREDFSGDFLLLFFQFSKK